jgi:hypothetical protein
LLTHMGATVGVTGVYDSTTDPAFGAFGAMRYRIYGGPEGVWTGSD